MKSFDVSRSAAKWLGCGVLAFAAAACASNKQPETAANHGEMDVAQPSTPRAMVQTARKDSDTTVRVSEDIRRECKLPAAPQDAPHFDYDDATLRTRGANILDDVAQCLTDGALKGRMITIIGRTDPRGTPEYNKELSANRAEAARNYLAQHGVASSTVSVIARGEQGARGTDEETWALDRRVDLELDTRNVARTADGSPVMSGNATASPIMEGTRMQATTPGNASKVNAAPYSDTAEGGTWTGSKGASGSGKASGSASGSVTVGK
jgi:peptidoglycan-associated lipoprotein